MFDPIDHPHVGKRAIFLPPGSGPYDHSDHWVEWGTFILWPGSGVIIESAWTRPYLSDDAPVLFYVRSEVTGAATHVVEEDLFRIGGIE